MTGFSVVGVMLGVAALIVVLSVMGGFERDLKEKMLRGQPHIEILNQNAIAGFSLNDHPVETFRKRFPEAQALAPFVQSDVVIKNGRHLAAANLYGIEPAQSDNRIWAFYDSMIEGSLDAIAHTHSPLVAVDVQRQAEFPGISIGDELAGQLGAGIGDEISVVSPEARSGMSVLGGGTIARSFVVVGIFHTGLFDYDGKWAVTTLPEARRFMTGYDSSLDAERYVTGIAMNSSDPYSVATWAKRLDAPSGLKAHTWQDANSALLFALLLEKYTMGAILLLIVVVAAFSISGTMMMTVFHRKSQVCLLRSIGMTQKRIGALFLCQGLTVGAVGIVFGLGLGLGILFFIEKARYFGGVSQVSLSFQALPVRYLPFEYGIICFLALLLSALGALYPAITAARQNASSGLRYS